MLGRDPLGLAATLEKAAAELRRLASQRTWIDQFRDGDILTASTAATVANNTPKTIREWCEAAEGTSRPLGFLGRSVWLVDAYALLDEIELRRDLYARREAETRLEQYRKTLAASPRSLTAEVLA